MKTTNSNKLAFSLIELSVVILVIGILVIGITKGSTILKNAKIKSARALTAGSPVNSISNLALWLDATNSSSIATGTTATNSFDNAEDGSNVVSWKSFNSQSDNQITVSATSDANRAQYIASGLNGLPSISFNGTSSAFESTVAPIRAGNQNMTLFIVSSKSNINSYAYMVGQYANSSGTGGANDSMTFYTVGTGGITYVYTGILCATMSCYVEEGVQFGGYQSSKPSVMGVSTSTNSTRFYYNKLTSVRGALPSTWSIGSGYFVVGTRKQSGSNGIWFGGLISEVIMFNRTLSANEMSSVSEYLMLKYGIK